MDFSKELTKVANNLKFASEKIDFQYCVNTDYRVERNCAEESCNDSGICRCGKIVDEEVTSVDLKSVVQEICSFYKIKDKGIKKELEDFCNFINVEDKSIYTIVIGRGYYGQEIEGVYMDSNKMKAVEKKIEELKK